MHGIPSHKVFHDGCLCSCWCMGVGTGVATGARAPPLFELTFNICHNNNYSAYLLLSLLSCHMALNAISLALSGTKVWVVLLVLMPITSTVVKAPTGKKKADFKLLFIARTIYP